MHALLSALPADVRDLFEDTVRLDHIERQSESWDPWWLSWTEGAAKSETAPHHVQKRLSAHAYRSRTAAKRD